MLRNSLLTGGKFLGDFRALRAIEKLLFGYRTNKIPCMMRQTSNGKFLGDINIFIGLGNGKKLREISSRKVGDFWEVLPTPVFV
jgi:hypothetical protein